MGCGNDAEEVFNKAVELSDPDDQVAYLDEACGGDEKLRVQVEALLRWHQEAGSFLEVPAVDPNVTLETSASDEGPGAVIGRYKLLEKVGEGGMATVYMAEQKHPIRRRVALKIIKLGMDTKQVIARFEAERQALAMMDHPNIAKVLDAGTTDTGRPYFVMELVRGVPITEFCDKNHLSTQERLQLFITVCQAVQHAHQRGIIHRDIKPSNILVTLHDGEPVPKVIDFWIAKAVNQQLTEKTVFTRYSQMIGTPEYMSPEQAEMSGLDIDTRTDVFSLGVLLYELLTGMTPFDSEYLLSKGYSEMQRIIREEEPLRPSTKVSTLGETLTDVAKHRRTSPELLCKLIRTDLDWIVMKTLEKDRNRRYESVSELAADVKRHLDDEPVLAGRPSTIYRVQKFVKRNRVLVASASVITAVLVVATTVSLWQMVRANRAAEHEKVVSTQLGIEKDRAVKAEQIAQAAEQTATRDRDRAEASEQAARLNLYAADMIAAQKYLDDGNLGAAQSLLKSYTNQSLENDVRGWEWPYLWGRTRGDQEKSFGGHRDTVTSMAFSPGGELFASGGMDQLVIVRDRAGKELAQIKTNGKVNSISFSSDGKYLAAGCEKGVLIWDTTRFVLFRAIEDREEEGAFAVFSPSHTVLAIGYGGGTVHLWDYAADGEGVWLGKPNDSYAEDEQRFMTNGLGCRLAFSSDGAYLVKNAAGAGLYEVWETEGGRCVASLKNPLGAFLLRWGNATFVPGKRLVFLACLNEGAVLWDFESGQTVLPIGGSAGCKIVQAVYSPDGTLMASAGLDHAVRLWESSGMSYREKDRFLGHQDEVWAIAMSPDADQVVSGGRDTRVLMWNTGPKEVIKVVRRRMQQCIPCFSTDGTLVALAGGGFVGNFRTLFYDLVRDRFLDTEARGFPVAFTEDKSELVTADGNTVSGEWMVSRWAPTDSKPLWEARNPGIGGSPSCFPVACEDRKLAAQGFYGGDVAVINYAEGRMLKSWRAHDSGVSTLAFSPDGQLVVTGESTPTPDTCSVVVWSCSDLENIEPRHSLERHQQPVHAAIFTRDGRLLATGDSDGRIILWDVNTGGFRCELYGHKQDIYTLAFSREGKTLASASHDGTVKLWHVATGRELITFALESCGTSVAFSPDGNTLVATSGPNPYEPDRLYIWRVSSLKEIEGAMEIAVQE